MALEIFNESALMEAEFNAGQIKGIRKIVEWYVAFRNGETDKQVFFLTGDAGTGKTHMARKAAAHCVEEYAVTYIAPTGKAASVLRKKGCVGAKTMHQFAYNLAGEDEDGDPIFNEKLVLDESPRLIVLDEASMVGDYQLNTLTSHRIPILALGDLSQIPPVKAAQAFTESHVDHVLTEIVRQQKDSKIIQAAQIVKQGKRIPPREYSDARIRVGYPDMEELLAHAGEDAQILCSYNRTRDAINAKIRKEKGYTGDLPQIGEKVMCWFNQHSHNFMNGESGIIESYEAVPAIEYNDEFPLMQYAFIRSLNDNRVKKVKFNPDSFALDPEIKKIAQKNIGGFDYGYCCTIHKAQGSEWPRVMIIEEAGFSADYAKLMYTAITRAQEQFTLYRKK